MAVHRVPIPNYTSSAEGSSPPPSSLGQSLGGGVNFPSTTNRTPTSNANSKMSAFRPQGRLPLDPFSTATTEVGGPSGGTTATGSRKEKGRPFHWTITGEDVQEVWQRCKFEQGKVVLILGAPSERDLGPLLSSQLLSKSLVIIATKQPPSKLFLSTHGPAFVILRLQPYSLSGPSAQQQLHSILTRAGDVAHRWRKDRQSFFDSESLRGRSKQRKQSKSTEAAQIRAVQFSELGGVFGGAFVVKEDVGYDPDASTVSTSSKTETKKSSPAKKTQARDQCLFDALINFIPAAIMDEETLLRSISVVSMTSRTFLSSSAHNNSGDQRGRSMSKGSRGRSSSLDRIKKWMSKSRSRSRARSRSRLKARDTTSNSNSTADTESNTNGESDSTKLSSAAGEKRRAVTESSDAGESSDFGKGKDIGKDQGSDGINTCNPSPSTPPPSPFTTLEGNDLPYEAPKMTSRVKKSNSRWSVASSDVQSKKNTSPRVIPAPATLPQPAHIRKEKATKGSGNAKRTERGVLTSWSRNRLDQANRVAENKLEGANRGHDRDAQPESKAYLVHVLPLPPPLHVRPLIDASFAPSRQNTLHSDSHASALSSSETDIPHLDASVGGRELKDNRVSHLVPPALKPESVKSSMAIALIAKHKRGMSLDSMVSSFPKSETQKIQSGMDNKTASSEKSDAGSEKTRTSSPHDSATVSTSVDHQTSLDSQPIRRRALSPAVEAAVESATRYSLYASSRALSASSTDMGLRRQSTALQVASAAAMAAMEVHFAKATESTDSNQRLQSFESNEKDSSVTPENEPKNGDLARGRTRVASEYVHSRQSTLSTMGIPNALMPHPHRQSSLVPENTFSLDSPLATADTIHHSGSSESAKVSAKEDTDHAPPTPVALLPRPHARARALSLEQTIRSPLESNYSSRSTSLFTAAPSLSTALPSSDPNHYYEKTPLAQTIEGFLLSHSYRTPPSLSSAVSLPTLPKGAAKPVTIGGAASSGNSSWSPRKITQLHPTKPQEIGSAPVSYLLPQGLLDLLFKMPSFVPEESTVSIMDLILHGLLDPSSESLALYRDAVALAAKMNPGGIVTLNGLMALGALSGEEAGAAHSMPRAWIGGAADIDVQGATKMTFDMPGVNNVSKPLVIATSSLDPSSVIPKPPLSAVSLHSMTVALSPRASSASPPDSPRLRSTSMDKSQNPSATLLAPYYTFTSKLNVAGLESGEEDGWKQFVKKFIPGEEKGTELRSDTRIEPTRPPIITSQTSPPPNSVVIRSRPLLAQTSTAPELPSLKTQSPPIIPKTKLGAIPLGAALPINPHLPSVHSSFPRHSVFLNPTNLNFNPCPDRDTEPLPERTTESDVAKEPEEVGASPPDEEVNEAASVIDGPEDTPSSNLESESTTVPLASSTPALSDEADLPEPTGGKIEHESEVTVDTVSDTKSVIIDSLPYTSSFLLENEQGVSSLDITSDVTSISEDVSATTEPLEAVGVSVIPVESDLDCEREPSDVHSRSPSPSTVSSSSLRFEEGKGDSKLWLQRSPKPAGELSSLPSPSNGYFSGIEGSGGRERESSSEFVVSSESTVRRRSTLPSMPSSALNDLGSDAKSKRFSKAISWMVTEPDSSSSMIADEAVKPPVNDLSSTPTTSSSLASVPRDKEIMPSTNTGPSIMATRSAEDLNSIDHSSSDPSSPHLSILSLSLHNLSSRSESPPKPMAMAPPGPLAVVQRRLSPANSISRRDSTGPVGPRAPRSSGSLRRPISPGPSSLSSAPERTQSSHPLRPLPKPELSRSSTLQVQDQSEAQLALKSEDKDEEGEISTTPPPLPALTPVSVINNGGSSSNESRPTSRPGSRSSSTAPTAFTPLRKLGIDEVPMPSDDTSTEGGHTSDAEGRPGLLGLTKVVSRGGAGSTARTPRISAGAGARRISITSAGDDADRSAKSKWKFWSSGNRPVSMMVDLTKD